MVIPELWRSNKARYSLQGEVCPECDRLVFPPRRLCPYCGQAAHEHETGNEYKKGETAPSGPSGYEWSYQLLEQVGLPVPMTTGDD